jgi:hypothetical protein
MFGSMRSISNSESSPSASRPLEGVLFYVVLTALTIAPLIFGSYPPWIGGLTVAVFCGLGVLSILWALIFRADYFPVPGALKAFSYLLLAWLSGMVVRDVVLGTAQWRAPALSLRTLPYAFAFLSAGMLGARLGATRLKTVLWAVTVVGVILGALTITQWMGFDVKSWKHNTQVRVSGIFVNVNRLAVMESLCISCALALFLAAFKEPEVGRPEEMRRRARQGVLASAMLCMGMAMVLTLSRLSIITFGVGLGLIAFFWMRHRMQRDARDSWGASRSERVRRWLVVALPMIVMLAWVAGAFSFGGQTLNKRILELGKSESGEQERIQAFKAAWPLLGSTDARLFGHGLGNFEFAFNAIQPMGLSGRWTRLHSDWVQLAMEAGIAALALAVLLTVFWFRAWLTNVREAQKDDDEESLVLQLVPLAGIVTILICTAADFPLRETGLALAFFFLTGALARSKASAAGGTGWAGFVLAPLLLAGLGWNGFVAGRNGAAYAVSPARGQYMLPLNTGDDPAAWERAVTLDPGDPQLHVYLAAAANNATGAAQEVYAAGLEHALIGKALSPRDCSMPWLAALLSEKKGEWGEAPGYFDQAIARFPNNFALLRDAGAFFIRRARIMPLGTSFRDDAVARALDFFRYVIRYQGAAGNDELFVKWMEEAECTPEQVAQIWDGDAPAARLMRAKYYWKRGRIELTAEEIAALSPDQVKAGKSDTIWYDVLAGRLEFARGEEDAAVAHWLDALKLGAPRVEEQAYLWMAAEAWNLTVEAAKLAAEKLADNLKDAPLLVNVLGRKLHDSGKNVDACILLQKTAGTMDYLCVLWAESALAMNDIPTAEEQAARALKYQRAANDLSQWHAHFLVQLSERKRVKQ